MSRRWLALGAAIAAAVAALAACSPIGTLNALVASDTYRLQAGAAYGTLLRQKLDVYTPVTATPANGWPVVVFFYGGFWTSGERAEYKFMGEALASHGVLALVADYRLYPETSYPGFIEDSAKALAWGLDNAKRLGGDPARVFVMGHSAGGYNAAMLALEPAWLKATGHAPGELAGWIGVAGAYDFFPLEEGSPARPVFHHPDYPKNAQPVEFDLRGTPPAFLAAPNNDKVVSPQRSTLALAAKLRAANVPLELKMYDGVSHQLIAGAFGRPLRGLAPVLGDLVAWIDATPPRPRQTAPP